MALFEWKQDYSVSVNEFDADHKSLFSLVNELNDAMAHGQGRLVIGNVLQRLLQYTRDHFAAEEAAMRAADFDGLAAHVAEHRELTEKVEAFAEEYSSGHTSVTIDVLYFLRDWLEHHVCLTDQKYSEPLNKRGTN
ncbi:MAG: bacteriohemerythrin [Candidatus Acidiferrum sp.]|jgi:hemerythrin-like metal-binding protein